MPGGDGMTLFLRATFGILVSKDGGKTWRWICERSLGYEGTWDPPIAVTKDGRLWVGLEGGLVSTKDGCEVEATPELDGETVKDLTTDPKGETLWAITGAPTKKSWVWRREDGKKFEKRSGMDDTNFMTIEVAPTRPQRVYVSGQPYGTIRGQLFRSDDGGLTLTGAKNDQIPDGPFFIAGIDPKDPNRVLLRHLHAQGSEVLLTKDGGKTFTNVLSLKSAMYGFAKSDNGTTYWAGSGLPEHGIYRSIDRGEHFERVANKGVLCLQTAGGGRLYICENALTPGAPIVAVSTDEGKTITSLSRFSDVEGPVACVDPDARASLCASSWPETRAFLAGASPDAGSRKKKRDAGPDSASDAGPDAPPSSKSKCGCEIVGAPILDTDLALLIAGLLPLAVRACSRRLHGSRLIQSGRSSTTRWREGARQ